jgi:hypothetical protein
MRTPVLVGPYNLNKQSIEMIVTRTMPGAYVLGRSDPSREFVPEYCSRADMDLGARLRDHIGLYQAFMFQYALSPEAAFEIECALFHEHAPRHNPAHPRAPMGSGHRCPICEERPPKANARSG